MTDGSRPRLAYRPGLDGVRALAVAAVVLYHGRVAGFPGGFLGVDVFFVLSGFLITSLLLEEHARTGAVDLLRFWMGRVRRLLPAALLVVAVSLVVVALLSRVDLRALRGDALWSVLYANNWHQVFAARSYFESFGRPSLLQHFWSLAVEEQFYLLWPPLLLLALRLRMRPPLIGLLALGGALASFVLTLVLYDPHADATRVYYGTDTRALPLLLGVALAFAWPAMRGGEPAALRELAVGVRARLALDAAGVIGLGVVLLGVLAWSDFDPFVYRFGLGLVAVGAALLIASVAHPASDVGRALGWAPLVWIGARSYGIYLWHWPVMAMSRPGLDVRVSGWLLVPVQVLATVVLAALSYRYVEMPIRRGTLQARVRARLGELRAPRRRTVLVGAPALALLLVAAALVAWPAGVRTLPHGPSASASASALASSSMAGLGPAQAAPPAGAPADPGAAPRSPGARSDGAPAGSASAPARAAPRRPVLAVGASVMLAAGGALHHRVHARVDAAVSRQPAAIEARLEEYRTAHALPPVVVVQTGENGPLYKDDLLGLKQVLRGVPRVVLLTVRAPTVRWADDTNAKLRELAAGWPQATIADWHAVSANRDLLFDGTHPNARGARAYARVVNQAIGR